jgi:hypothetical protein
MDAQADWGEGVVIMDGEETQVGLEQIDAGKFGRVYSHPGEQSKAVNGDKIGARKAYQSGWTNAKSRAHPGKHGGLDPDRAVDLGTTQASAQEMVASKTQESQTELESAPADTGRLSRLSVSSQGHITRYGACSASTMVNHKESAGKTQET